MSSKKAFSRVFLLVLSVLIVLIFISLSFAASSPFIPSVKREICSSDQVLVKFKPGTTKNDIEKIHLQNKGKVSNIIPEINVQVVKVDKNKVLEKVSAYQRNPNVEFAEPDYLARAVSIPNDVYFDLQWGLHNTGQTGGTPDADIDAPEAWDTTKGSKKIKIAVLDTGIDQDHEDLATKIVLNKNFTSSKTANDMFGHGTHVAGIAAANTSNNKGVAGTGYDCPLMNIKVLGDDGSGNYSWVTQGIIWSVAKGAKVINMSLTGDQPSKTLEMAVDFAWRKGAILVTAAGNEGCPTPTYPAFYQNCIAVGATDDKDSRSSFSNYGDWVDLAAPGGEIDPETGSIISGIYSTTPNHESFLNQYGIALNYDYLIGTSTASPHVAGIAALVMSKYPGISNVKVREMVEKGTDPAAGFDPWPVGRANAYKALKLD
ncbi:MAG: S8 family peptidase [Peptococcaceae bacterium]